MDISDGNKLSSYIPPVAGTVNDFREFFKRCVVLQKMFHLIPINFATVLRKKQSHECCFDIHVALKC